MLISVSKKGPQSKRKKPATGKAHVFMHCFRLLIDPLTGHSVGRSKKTRKGDVFFLFWVVTGLLTVVSDSFKTDHPVAAQSASSTGLKRLLRNKVSEKVGKAKRSRTGRNAQSKSP
jgi:hypothetical protein